MDSNYFSISLAQNYNSTFDNNNNYNSRSTIQSGNNTLTPNSITVDHAEEFTLLVSLRNDCQVKNSANFEHLNKLKTCL